MYSIYISKADKVLSVDFDSLPEVSKRFIIEYGLKQKLNDAGSSATVKELGPNEAAKQAFALAEASLQALASGQISVRIAKPQESLEEREYKKLLRSMLKKAFPQEQEALMESGGVEALAALHKVESPRMEAALRTKAKANAEIERKKRELSALASTIDLDL